MLINVMLIKKNMYSVVYQRHNIIILFLYSYHNLVSVLIFSSVTRRLNLNILNYNHIIIIVSNNELYFTTNYF